MNCILITTESRKILKIISTNFPLQDMDDNRRGSKHVSFMEHRSGLVRSQTTSSFEESSAHMGPAARWRMAAARSQERLLDGPMIKPKKQPCYVAHQEDGPKPNKTVIMGKRSLFLLVYLKNLKFICSPIIKYCYAWNYSSMLWPGDI